MPVSPKVVPYRKFYALFYVIKRKVNHFRMNKYKQKKPQQVVSMTQPFYGG